MMQLQQKMIEWIIYNQQIDTIFFAVLVLATILLVMWLVFSTMSATEKLMRRAVKIFSGGMALVLLGLYLWNTLSSLL